jgi:hypothetical protein
VKETLDALLDGFMVPIFHDPASGLNGLSPADFTRVRLGYGCPKCLAKYKTYLAACPVPGCGWVRDVEQDFVEAPQMWVDHLAERHRGETEKTRPLTFDEFMAEVARDPEIERRKL